MVNAGASLRGAHGEGWCAALFQVIDTEPDHKQIRLVVSAWRTIDHRSERQSSSVYQENKRLNPLRAGKKKASRCIAQYPGHPAPPLSRVADNKGDKAYRRRRERWHDAARRRRPALCARYAPVGLVKDPDMGIVIGVFMRQHFQTMRC